MSLRSPLGRALGLGSAKDGIGHWWAQRVSAVALVPLTLWFLFAMLALPALEYSVVHAWLARPMNAVLTVLLLAALGQHAHLGLAVVVEDYVHSPGLKILTLMLLRFAFVLTGAAGVFAVLHVAFAN